MPAPLATRRPAKGSAPDADPSAGLHLVLGPEDLLADRAVERVVAAARAASPGTQVIAVDSAGYSRGDLTAHASPTLFGEGTVIVVRGVEDAGDELVEDARRLVEQPEPEVVLVLRHRSGQRGKGLLDAARTAGAAVHDCPKVTSDADKATFVAQEFRKAGRAITPDAVDALVQALGQDLRELASACSQLVADTVAPDQPAGGQAPPSEPPLDAATVERYYGGRVEATGFKVADAAIVGQTEQALGLLRHALSCGVDPVPLVAVLAMGLRSLAKVGAASSVRPADAARDLGMAPWQVEKARRQLRGWSQDGLATAIEAVACADLAVKGGLPAKGRRAGDPVYAVEKAVLAIGAALRG